MTCREFLEWLQHAASKVGTSLWAGSNLSLAGMWRHYVLQSAFQADWPGLDYVIQFLDATSVS
jgi:hypothetical protein